MMNDNINPNVMDLPEFETVDLKGHIISNKMYDLIKGIVTLFLPGFGTLYYSLAEIWNFGAGEQVLASCSALAIFLGLFIKFADMSYNKSDTKYDGNMVVSEEDGNLKYSFEATTTPLDTYPSKSELIFKVK
jgi:hypothetical protein